MGREVSIAPGGLSKLANSRRRLSKELHQGRLLLAKYSIHSAILKHLSHSHHSRPFLKSVSDTSISMAPHWLHHYDVPLFSYS